jgi:hypothetical protein
LGYEKIKTLSEAAFRRLTGVKKKTFNKMIEILTRARVQKKLKGGKPNKLCIEDCLLMTLEYLREYRTYFHISQSYGISESACYRNIIWVENTLVKDKTFALPGRKALTKSDTSYEVILIDATESPIERPKKKAETILFRQEETAYSQNSGSR